MLAPDSASAPPARASPPAPPRAPEKVPLALASVSVCAPRLTAPPPDRDLIDAPAAVAEMSNVPLSTTPAEPAMPPVPDSARVAPLPMAVPPV